MLGNKDDDGRERRHTGGNASGTHTQQPGQTTGGPSGNKLLRQNSQNSQTQQNALSNVANVSKSNKGCGQDQTSNTQGKVNIGLTITASLLPPFHLDIIT